MTSTPVYHLSLWEIVPGKRRSAAEILKQWVQEVEQMEPGTQAFHVRFPSAPSETEVSGTRLGVEVLATFQDQDAYVRHTASSAYQTFLAASEGTLVCLEKKFIPGHAFLECPADGTETRPNPNAHPTLENTDHPPAPGVMVELIAKDAQRLKAFYEAVFGWQYVDGASGFAYVPYPDALQPRLAGVGQANPQEPGFEPGNHFYLQVPDLAEAIAKTEAAGGKSFVPPTAVDGYEFAMILDPEGNEIGLIKPFN